MYPVKADVTAEKPIIPYGTGKSHSMISEQMNGTAIRKNAVTLWNLLRSVSMLKRMKADNRYPMRLFVKWAKSMCV